MKKKAISTIFISLLLLFTYSCSDEGSTSSNNSSSSDASSSASSSDYFCLAISSEHYTYPSKILIDSADNIYIVGFFKGTVDFDTGTGIDNHTSKGSTDIFITKINANGSYAWTKTFGSTQDDEAYRSKLDSSGNIYMTGYFSGTVDFNPNAGTDYHTSNGERDIFLTKININGTYGWTKTMGGSGYDTGCGIAFDAQKNIYITGSFNETVDFDPSSGTDNHSSNGYNDIFVTKINANGSYGWTKTFGGTGSDWGNDLKLSSNGAIYIVGEFSNSVDFDTGAGIDNHSSKGSTDIFITKINSDGSYGWTKTMGSPNICGATHIELDSIGNLYIGGYFRDTVDFDPGTGTDNHQTIDMSSFLTKINSDGTYGWTKIINQGGITLYAEFILDSSDNIYITGYFENSPDFNTGQGSDIHTSKGDYDIFITKINSDGSYGWTKTMGGSNYQTGTSLALDSKEDLYIIGYFMGATTFDWSNGKTNYTSTGERDIFIMKMSNQ